MSAIGPKHHSYDDSWEIAARFSWRLLQFPVGIQESRRCVKLTVYPLFDTCVTGWPIELKWLVIKLAIVLRFCEFFVYDSKKRLVVKIAYMVILRARDFCSMVERNRDSNWSSDPSSILIHPLCLFIVLTPVEIVGGQFRIKFCPICLSHILWPKFQITNNIQKLVKTCMAFLDSVVPVPVC